MWLLLVKCFMGAIVGLILQGGYGKPKNLRILGVLQRLALCYFFTAVIILIFDEEDQSHSPTWPIGKDKPRK